MTDQSPTKSAILEEETVELWDSWDPMSEDYHSSRNTLRLNPTEQPECDVTGKMMNLKIGGQDVCNHYIRYGSCADGKFCDRLHVTPKARDKLWTIAEKYDLNKARTCLTYSYLSPTELTPNPQTLLLISVAYIKSPGEFVFIAPYEQMNFSNFNDEEIEFYVSRVHQSSTYKTKLQKCHEQLAALFNHNYRIDNVNDEIFLSQIVACKLDNGRFCRAMVVELDDFSNEIFDYKLFLIDIGIVVNRPRELIYDIRANCLSEPPMATSGRLNLKPANGQLLWPEVVSIKFREKLMSKKYLLCRVLDYLAQDRAFVVDLLDIKSRVSLTEKMIEIGMAEECSKTKQKPAPKSWDDL